MKKAAAVLMSLAIVLTMAGCGKSEETKTTKKSKKTKKETEITETTETTEDPYISMIEPSTTESDEPTDTTPAPVAASSTALHSELYTDTFGYGKLQDSDGYKYTTKVLYGMEYIEFSDSKYLDMQRAVVSYYEMLESELHAIYDTKLADYKKDSKENIYVEATTYIMRDDSYIFSYAVKHPSAKEDFDGYDTFNYWTESGEEIKLNDVITNNYLFIAAVVKCGMQAKIPDESLQDQTFQDSLRDGTCDFALTYDGLYLFFDYFQLKVPLSELKGAYNEKYFGHEPEEYFLTINADATLQYDFDRDGNEDSLLLEAKHEDPNDPYSVSSIAIHLNNDVQEVKEGIWGEFNPEYGEMYLMKTEDALYLYLTVGVDEGTEYVAYEYANGTWTYVNRFDDGEYFYAHPYDPHDVKMSRYIGIFGTNFMYSEYDLTKNHGLPTLINPIYFTEDNFICATTDVPCHQLNDNYEVIAETTIPKGSIVQILAYTPDDNQFLLSICFEDGTENYCVSVDVAKDADSYTIGGIPLSDAFTGLNYAG